MIEKRIGLIAINIPDEQARCSWCGVRGGHDPRCYVPRELAKIAERNDIIRLAAAVQARRNGNGAHA